MSFKAAIRSAIDSSGGSEAVSEREEREDSGLVC